MLAAGLVSFLSLSSAYVAFFPSAQADPQPVGQTGSWSLTFRDEFDGAAVNRATWRSDYFNGGNGELQEYVDDDSRDNYLVGGGALSLVARKESYAGKQYTSGIIATQDRFAQKYGYFEIRARVPRGKGLWPAFWLMPNPTGWPPEIDVLEILCHDTSTVYMSLHYKNADGTHGSSTSFHTGADFAADWHTFGIDWQPEAIVWYVDGVERKRIADTTKIPDVPMFVLVNLAVGGSWPGDPDPTTPFPSSYEIDYVRVWTDGDGRPSSDNLIHNPSFEVTSVAPWYSPWIVRNDLGAIITQDGTTASDGVYSFKGQLSSANPSQPWVVALMQGDKSLATGQSYTLSFDAKASASRSIVVVLQEQVSPYTEYLHQSASLSTSWTSHSYVFTPAIASSTIMLNLNLAGATGEVWIDNVVIASSSGDTTPPGAPILLSPLNGTPTGDRTPVFDWSDVSDPSGLLYHLQVDDRWRFAYPEIDARNLTESRFEPASPLARGHYRWRVRAVDGAGNVGPWSSFSSVRIR